MRESAVVRVYFNNKVLLLKRCVEDNIQGWCLAGGKIDPNELNHIGAARELFEETGIIIDPHILKYKDAYTSVYRHLTYIVSVYDLYLDTVPTICLSNEHTDYLWASSDQYKDIDLAGNTLTALNI